MIVKDTVIGRGGANADLSVDDMRPIVEEALAAVPSGSRVLAVISDRTRDDNTPELFPLVSRALAARRDPLRVGDGVVHRPRFMTGRPRRRQA